MTEAEKFLKRNMLKELKTAVGNSERGSFNLISVGENGEMVTSSQQSISNNVL